MDIDSRLTRRGWTVTESGCWEFNGYSHRQGYGMVKVNRKNHYAHRLAYETWVGPIPEGHMVRHKCDNPPCINPDHLETGTMKDNVRDRESRGRSNHAQGERVFASRVTAAQVREIRERYAKGGITHRELGVEFGISRTSISKIIRRENWRSV